MVKIDDNDFPDYLYFHRDHMWVKIEEGKARVGYNDWAQEAAGKLLNLNTRKIGRKVKAGKTLGTVESGKWVGPLKAPISGEIVELNDETLRAPSIINEDPYGRGWIAIISPDDLEKELGDLIKGDDAAGMEAWLRGEKERHRV